jgi:hypothetical protein
MPLLAAMFALLGVTLGSPAVDLRAKLGDPLLVERLSDLSRTADYLRADDPSAVLKVTERNGVVFAVEVERERPEPLLGVGDHYGVRLGMSRATVKAKRGKGEIETVNTLLYPEDFSEDATFIYRFDVASADVLEAIKLVASGTTAPGDPALPQLAEAPGDHFRDRYLTLHGCVDSGRASIIDRRETQTFAVATATCAGKKRSFYFDITRARPAHS